MRAALHISVSCKHALSDFLGLSHSLTELVYELITIDTTYYIDSCHNLWAGMGQIFLGLKENARLSILLLEK